MDTKEKLQDILKQHVVRISFKKLNGTDRKMVCSLKEDIFPIDNSEQTVAKRTKSKNQNILSVWDLEKHAFRSFRIDSLIDYSIIEEGYEL